ncbi:ABC transporter permease [uncultured Amnibacterium sp.]|uniref:ABC transporter permease n=1 Tax=uncultured Amnibacterium sp. TaxID=1631851 RepID=UPI0035C99F05
MTLNPSELEVVAENDGLTGPGVPEKGRRTPDAIVGRSLAAIVWRRLRSEKLALAGAIVIVIFILVAIFADVIQAIYGQSYRALNNDPGNTVLDPNTNLPIGAFGGISAKHWFGITPSLGQDVFMLLVFGARTSLIIAGLATVLSLVLGVTTGLLAGYYRGWVDTVISRIMDVLLSFPTLLFSLSMIAVVAIITSASWARFAIIIFVLGFFGFPYIGRIVRGQVLSLREKEFVEAARSLGASNLRIMAREIAPNLLGPILVYTTLTIPNNILGEAGLSFLGLGVQPPTPSWGQMLSDAGDTFQNDPVYLLLPGLAIFLIVLAFNLFGDGLRDALDPKSRR